MKVMVLIKSTRNTEAGVPPSGQVLAEMGQFNEALVNAGMMLAGEGLHPSSKGRRVSFSKGKQRVIDGPFAETKELICGFWMWKVQSMDEAVQWVKRIPNPHHEDFEVEIREVFELDDIGPEFTPELRAQEERLRARVEGTRK